MAQLAPHLLNFFRYHLKLIYFFFKNLFYVVRIYYLRSFRSDQIVWSNTMTNYIKIYQLVVQIISLLISVCSLRRMWDNTYALGKTNMTPLYSFFFFFFQMAIKKKSAPFGILLVNKISVEKMFYQYEIKKKISGAHILLFIPFHFGNGIYFYKG